MMTNQEAIEILREKIFPCVTGDWKEAVGVAISALQAQDLQPTCNQLATVAKDICVPCKDTISRQDALDALNRCTDVYHTNLPPLVDKEEVRRHLTSLPSAQPEPCKDAVSRADVVDMLEMFPFTEYSEYETAREVVKRLPSAEPEWNNHTVACLLADLFDDTCACNYNGIDEWLPEKCEVIDSCPNPVGVACWEQYLKHRAERRTDE